MCLEFAKHSTTNRSKSNKSKDFYLKKLYLRSISLLNKNFNSQKRRKTRCETHMEIQYSCNRYNNSFVLVEIENVDEFWEGILTGTGNGTNSLKE